MLGCATAATAQVEGKSKVDYVGFDQLTSEVYEYRNTRLVGVDTFNLYSREAGTIILDTRSKAAYDEIHIKGAIHLNFSDFTTKKLADVIPSKETRILIYCNNNVQSDLNSMRDKAAPLALNIPTFINLYGYGYMNIYELKDYLSEFDDRIEFVRK